LREEVAEEKEVAEEVLEEVKEESEEKPEEYIPTEVEEAATATINVGQLETMLKVSDLLILAASGAIGVEEASTEISKLRSLPRVKERRSKRKRKR